MKIKYLLFLTIVGIGAVSTVYFYGNNKNCIFPPDTQINLVLYTRGDNVYTLTRKGMIYRGTLDFFGHKLCDKETFCQISYGTSLDYSNEKIYLTNHTPMINYLIDMEISEIDLKEPTYKKKTIITTACDPMFSQIISVAPQGDFLLYNVAELEEKYIVLKGKRQLIRELNNSYSTMRLLDLKDDTSITLTYDAKACYGPGGMIVVWISDYQFLYTNVNNELILYDIKSFIKKNLGLRNYYLGGKIDNENILLSDEESIYKYNLRTENLEKIINVDRKGTTNEDLVLWIPQLNGFLYSEITWYDVFHQLEAHNPDLFFYSMDKKKKILLMREEPIRNGFILPDNFYNLLEQKGIINPTYYKDYKRIPKHIKTICRK